MPDTIASLVSDKLNLSIFQLANSERCSRILRHYQREYDARPHLQPTFRLQHFAAQACANICGASGHASTDQRTEPRL